MKLSKEIVSLKLNRDINIIGEKIEELKKLNPAKENFKKENYRLTLELCTWITVAYDFWAKNDADFKRRMKENTEVRSIFLSIKQAFNSFKHNFDIIGVGYNEQTSFDSAGNSYYINHLVWLPSELLEDDANNKDAFEAYQTCFEGESVVIKLNSAFQILLNELMRGKIIN